MNSTTVSSSGSGSGSGPGSGSGSVDEESGNGTPSSYSSDRCNFWLGILADSDTDTSNGISESEYFNFLSGIDEPPYIAAYFEEFTDFDDLPWLFRLVHKSLACHCQRLGYGDGCCEGNSAELMMFGPTRSDNSSIPVKADAAPMDYRDLICQQVSFVLERSVPIPQPTASPSLERSVPIPQPTASPSETPTKLPSTTPTGSPSASPVTAGPTISPSVSPVLPPGPTVSPTLSSGPTLQVAEPLGKFIQSPDPDTDTEFNENEESGIGTGALAGIIVAAIVVLILLIALVAYRRRRERIKLRKFAGDHLPDADLEVPCPDDERVLTSNAPPEPEPRRAPDEDDESSAPSVWSDADELAGTIQKGNGQSQKMVGSSLAAMGAASTVAKTLMSSPPSKHRVD